MVSCSRSNFANPHKFVTRNADWILKAILVPKLEYGHVEAYVGWVEVVIGAYFFEEAGQMFYIIHGFKFQVSGCGFKLRLKVKTYFVGDTLASAV